MVNVNFLVLNTGDIKGFNILGHSLYSEYGKDIVCAAISSAVYLVINTITDIYKVDCQISVNESSGKLNMKIKDERELYKCEDLLKGLELHLCGLSETYPKNISIGYIEV